MPDARHYTGMNRTAWNLMAPSRPLPPAGFFENGGTTLEDIEIEALPDVNGLRLLHLACANGVDSLSWAARGASVVGVDISEAAIEIANSQALASTLDARFVAADLYDLPADLGPFDVVYSSWGVVCWLPDLAQWAGVITRCLKDGGLFLLCEHHPVWEVLAIANGTLQVTVDYFGRATPTWQEYDEAKRPVGWTSELEVASFTWPVSDVVMSLVDAGLRLTEFSEQPMPRLYEGLGSPARWLPATYLIKARKE